VEFAEGATFEVLLYPTAPVVLSGRLVLPDGNAAVGATVTLSGRDQVAGEELTAVADAAGAFAWSDVLPGVYRLSATSAEASFVSERWEILAGGEVVIVLVDNASRTPFEETGCSSVPTGRAGGAWWLAVISGLAWLRRRSFAA
jgi:MYXO-CTERM domain-containing protein